MVPTQHRLLETVLNRIAQRIALALQPHITAHITLAVEAAADRVARAIEEREKSSAGKTLARKRWDENGHKQIDLIEFNRGRRGF